MVVDEERQDRGGDQRRGTRRIHGRNQWSDRLSPGVVRDCVTMTGKTRRWERAMRSTNDDEILMTDVLGKVLSMPMSPGIRSSFRVSEGLMFGF